MRIRIVVFAAGALLAPRSASYSLQEIAPASARMQGVPHEFRFFARRTPALPIAGTDALFPVRRVYCVGRNYAAHGIEMGGDPAREPPFFFMKPADALQPVPDWAPRRTSLSAGQRKTIYFEIEMVVALKSGGRDIPVAQALDCVYGYAVGIDMTRRDLQDEAKQMRRPWELGKGGDNSGPVGPLHPVSQVGHPARGSIALAVDGTTRQDADLAEMIWSVAEQIAYLSRYFEVIARRRHLLRHARRRRLPWRAAKPMTASIDGLGSIALRVRLTSAQHSFQRKETPMSPVTAIARRPRFRQTAPERLVRHSGARDTGPAGEGGFRPRHPRHATRGR